MKQITVSKNMIDAARKKANDMGLLKNSITGGEGSVAGFLGEDCAKLILGGVEANTYDYDLKLENGLLCICTSAQRLTYSMVLRGLS